MKERINKYKYPVSSFMIIVNNIPKFVFLFYMQNKILILKNNTNLKNYEFQYIFFYKFQKWVVVLLNKNIIRRKKKFFANLIFKKLKIFNCLKTKLFNQNHKNKLWKKQLLRFRLFKKIIQTISLPYQKLIPQLIFNLWFRVLVIQNILFQIVEAQSNNMDNLKLLQIQLMNLLNLFYKIWQICSRKCNLFILAEMKLYSCYNQRTSIKEFMDKLKLLVILNFRLILDKNQKEYGKMKQNLKKELLIGIIRMINNQQMILISFIDGVQKRLSNR
ncbi:unnamed protein product [Paramecium sonneborni]|uniref:Transmembrane protein n=1 Tax=Paramecium sonneborni TaxID=65129 RepID=A0A8S1LM13_9CILI|nr:unnamed protein product [Paramecium sonneborni]